MEKESFCKFEYLNCELEDLKDMLWLMEEECFVFNISKYKDYELRDKFITAQIMTRAISKLLHNCVKESNEFIDEVYAERKVQKEGVKQCQNLMI